MHRFPHALSSVSLTGTTKGIGDDALQEPITPEDKFLSLYGDAIAVTVESGHLPLHRLLLRNDFKARERHDVNPKIVVPSHLRHYDSHTTIYNLIRALRRVGALHTQVEQTQIVTVERGLRRLYDAEITLPNFPDVADRTAWRHYTERIAATLGTVKDQRKVAAVQELLRLAETEPNLRRVALMLYMVERLLAERSDAMVSIDIRVSNRLYGVVRVLNDLLRFTKEIRRVALQCLSSDPILGNAQNRERQLKAVRYWHDHADELESCVIEPFRTQFQPIAVCFRVAATAMEIRNIPLVRTQMERVITLCDIINLRMDVESVLSPVAEMREIQKRREMLMNPTQEALWNETKVLWASLELEELIPIVESRNHSVPEISLVLQYALLHLHCAFITLREERSLAKAYVQLKLIADALEAPVTLE